MLASSTQIIIIFKMLKFSKKLKKLILKKNEESFEKISFKFEF
jgi:hypothetical protein